MIARSIHAENVKEVLRYFPRVTSEETAKLAAVAERTARHHLLELYRAGIAKREYIFPDGYRYSLRIE